MKAALIAVALLLGQDFGSLDAPPTRNHQFVQFAAENVTVAAGKKATLELRFQVEGGYHINSHTPKSELQIATVVVLDAAAGVKASAAEYPAGKLVAFAFDPDEKLDVYQDSFVVKVPVVASPGVHEVKGVVKYQACDRAACFPPKSLPITVIFTAK